ncbi:hypothetical protein ADK57_39265 [Streptomyces sp. MMG1533]|uniref:hypothetical protein n=1 Tax=Streptomyces sp. MMG1533 TaxID=1415546 RepID=UPI0006B01086|nr:hypothetical protein [Streptomyces sp. MMG1533]KOU57381.1 hypothetical protein ADK57_39265 [Streptomyces sp. MMG1533]
MGDGEQGQQDGRPILKKFDQRLNRLIQALYPDERTRPGFARLAAEIREATGGSISATYLWELSTGKKRNVTLEQLDVLAEFFGVPPGYFLDDEVAERVSEQLSMAAALSDVKVRDLALRSAGLSSVSLDAILAIVDEVRKVQNLPEVQRPDSDDRTG